MKPFLSVIIPCRNEVRFLRSCLDSVLANDYPQKHMEVLVADGESDDGTRGIIESYCSRDPRVRLIENPQRTTPVALNRAIEAAQGDVIVRIDAHATIPRDYFSNCVKFLQSSGADNVGGSMRTEAQETGLFSNAIVAALSDRFGVGNSYFRIGSSEPRWVDTVFGGCWRREVFDRIGRFNPDLKRSQDMEFSLRLKAAGGRTLLVPEIQSTYFARTRLGAFLRHNFTNGIWAVLPFVYSDIVPVSLRHFIPLVFVLALLASLAVLPWTAWLLLLIAGPYALANLAVSCVIVARQKKPSLLLTPLVFFLLHLSYGLGSLMGVVQALAKLRLFFFRSKEKSCIPQL
jgi:succinoglycan biosynthesis protein ExoA